MSRSVNVYDEEGRLVARLNSVDLRSDGAQQISFDVRPGDRLIVQPYNPRKKRHRGRIAPFVRVVRDRQDGYPSRLGVRFEGNGRPGKLDAADVLPVPPEKQGN